MKHIQMIDNIVNLIGDESVGLPLPELFLKNHPQILNLEADKYNPLPKEGDYYDQENDKFVTYQDWIDAQNIPKSFEELHQNEMED